MKEAKRMPLVHIDLIEGRSEEQLKGLVKDVTAAIAKNANVPEERIHIVLNEMRPDRYSVAGKMASDK
ncbi:2-hydroxymuconate tautomerase [Limosilactobacillus fermentum]|uniref:2-hydroxymuconate tautomerase n=1 Tax=Limosilactobacillus fermentum TaxID=1613 RepID=UPI002AD2B628|nr:2-hydroxymuconate tautomerase [Limosilactobacillus fermentum]